MPTGAEAAMELIFVRHGQGEHNLDVPGRLERKHPRLTQQGRRQVLELKRQLDMTANDLFVVSPTVRTIETLELLTCNMAEARLWVSPLLGPRMFPQNPAWTTLPCDIPLTRQETQAAYPWLRFRAEDDEKRWRLGINDRPQAEFETEASELLRWMRKQGNPRVFAISHDGTVQAYRELLGESGLSREDFLGEAGMYRINTQERKGTRRS